MKMGRNLRSLCSSTAHFDIALASLNSFPRDALSLNLSIQLDIDWLKIDVSIVKTFAMIAGKWRRSKLLYLGDGERLDCAMSRIPHLVCSVTDHIIVCHRSDPDEAMNLVTTLHEQIKLLAMEIKELYIILVDDYSLGDPDPRRVMDLINSISAIPLDAGDSLPACPPDPGNYYYSRDLLKALVKKLMFLNIFISFATMQLQGGVVEHMELMDLVLLVEFVALNAARVIHMWRWSADVDMQDEISQQLRMMTPVDADYIFRQTCIHVLAASKLSRSSHTFRLAKDSHVVVSNFIDYLLVNLVDLLRSCTNFMLSIMNQMKILYEELALLRKLFGEWQEKFNAMNDEMKDLIGVVVCDAGILIFSLSVNEMKEGLAKETDIALCHLLKVVKFIMAEVAQIYPPTSSSSFSFPKTNGLGLLDFLLENLEELASSEADSLVFLKDRIQIVQENILSLRLFLERIVEQRNKNEKLQALWNRVMEVAYKAEYVIDSILVGDKPDCSFLSLDTITEEIKFIRNETPEIYCNVTHDSQAQRVTRTYIHMPSKVGTPEVNEVLVGLDVEVKTIIDELIRGSKQLDIVSIVGMPGLGKTTLANRVYNDPLIVHHFRVRAWCTVSQIYSKHNLLHQILADNVFENPDQYLKMNEDDMAENLRKHLMRKKYLIVLDDVWDIEAWKSIRASLPDDKNGSRILFTSRSHNLSWQFKPDCKSHHLRILTDDESWELLQYKLFGKERCPPTLSDFGIQVAKSCKGLPLAIVIVAGILANLEQDSWENFAHSVSSSTVVGSEQCMKALELSYKHLPDYLKPCLLYFGAFQEDQDIPVRRLLCLWMSEGFVQKTKLKNLEDIAEEYLMELIGRSLVMVTRCRSIGGVKACRIHDLLHEFCVAKAKKESFLQILHGYNDHFSFTELYDTHRLGIYSLTEAGDLKSRLFLPHLRSLLVFSDASSFFGGGENNSFNSKLLRVLDLGFIRPNASFLIGVEWLVHLRYLAIYCSSGFIPFEIANLSRLETFLLKIIGNGSVELPDTIWNMKKLRHLRVKGNFKFNWVGFSLSTDNLEVFPDLCHLETFTLAINNPSSQSLQKIVAKLPSIRRLKCLASFEIYSKIFEFDSLSLLESLHVVGFRGAEFVFPQVLKKLTLRSCYKPWNEISTVGQLPNLEVLKLLYGSFVGETWEMKEGEFPKLRFLQLAELDIARWTASCDNFPPLQKLMLFFCKKLEELPSCLGDIPTIEIIEVRGCHQSTVSLVKQIQEEQTDIGNDCLKITVEELEPILDLVSDSDSDSTL